MFPVIIVLVSARHPGSIHSCIMISTWEFLMWLSHCRHQHVSPHNSRSRCFVHFGIFQNCWCKLSRPPEIHCSISGQGDTFPKRCGRSFMILSNSKTRTCLLECDKAVPGDWGFHSNYETINSALIHNPPGKSDRITSELCRPTMAELTGGD